MHTILSHFDIDRLLASFLGFSCYITANFPQMCLMLDQFLWGHLSRVCDISCFSGHLQSRVVYYLMNIHVLPRTIYLTRVSMYNLSKLTV